MAAVGLMPAPAGVLARERALAALQALLGDAHAGRGRLLAVEAPPGLGKSTLLAHAAAVATGQGMLVLRAAGRELEQELGWGVVRSLFEAWLLARSDAERGELLAGPARAAKMLLTAEGSATGPTGPGAAFALMHGMYWLTVHAAERSPLLVVVDDAQWADEPSLRFLLYLLGRLADQPIAVLVAGRSGEPGAGGLLALLLSDAETTVRELAPLSPDAVSALVRDRVADADEEFCARCFELTAGNPLFVRELSRAAEPVTEPDVPGAVERAATSLSRIVLRRLAALPDGTQALARAVAALEGGVALEHAGALAGLDADAALAAADALARADILREEEPLELVHPLLRTAVYGTLGRRERARVHGRAARLLLERDAPAEQVATHLLHAAPAGDATAVGALRAAATEAVAHGVPLSAIAYLERALREPPAAADRPRVLAELGRAEILAGRRAAAGHLQRAIDATPDPGGRAALRLELGRIMHDFGRLQEACTECELGLRELGEEADGSELGLDLQAWWLTSAMILVERADEAQRRATAVIAPSARDHARRPVAEVQGDASAALLGRLGPGRDGRGAERLRAPPVGGWPAARGRRARDPVRRSRRRHAQLLRRLRDGVDRAGSRAQACAARGLGDVRRRRLALLSRQLLWTGPLADAVADARIAFEIFGDGMQLYLPATGYCLARGLLESGAPEEAETVLARVDEGPAPVGMFAAWRAEAAGRLAGRRGDHEAALQAFLASGESLGRAVRNPCIFHQRSEAGLAALRAGDRALAERLIGEELALAETFGAWRAIGVARRAAGMLARGETAVELLRDAASLHAACGAALERALTLVELGAATRRAGRPGEARAILREAVALADRLGAGPLAERGRAELTLAGGRAPAARDTAGDLTPSERRVAELAAAGRTNRPDRRRALRDRQGGRVAPRQHLPQARHPRPRAARRRARRTSAVSRIAQQHPGGCWGRP